MNISLYILLRAQHVCTIYRMQVKHRRSSVCSVSLLVNQWYLVTNLVPTIYFFQFNGLLFPVPFLLASSTAPWRLWDNSNISNNNSSRSNGNGLSSSSSSSSKTSHLRNSSHHSAALSLCKNGSTAFSLLSTTATATATVRSEACRHHYPPLLHLQHQNQEQQRHQERCRQPLLSG